MWVGLVGDRTYEGSLSVEKDFGSEGTGGSFAVAGTVTGSVDEEVKRPLSRLFFLVRTRVLCVVGLSLASWVDLDSSGMLAVTANPFRLLASRLNEFLRDSGSFLGLLTSLLGEEDLDETKLFRRSRVNDLTGDMAFEFSDRFRLSLRLRSDLRSLDGSRLLLEKDANMDERRELLGLSCGISGIRSACGPSSSSGLEPSDKVPGSSGLMPVFRSSSEMVPLSSNSCGSSKSLTRGK